MIHMNVIMEDGILESSLGRFGDFSRLKFLRPAWSVVLGVARSLSCRRTMKRPADEVGEAPSKMQRQTTSTSSDEIPAEFNGLKGQLLVEAIFNKYGIGTMTVPWLNEDTKERNIRPDPCNRPVMESLAEAYTDRILTSGLNVDCSGRVLSKYSCVKECFSGNHVIFNVM